MEVGECTKMDGCFKVKMILDKDLPGDWLYAEAIRKVCIKCEEREKVRLASQK